MSTHDQEPRPKPRSTGEPYILDPMLLAHREDASQVHMERPCTHGEADDALRAACLRALSQIVFRNPVTALHVASLGGLEAACLSVQDGISASPHAAHALIIFSTNLCASDPECAVIMARSCIAACALTIEAATSRSDPSSSEMTSWRESIRTSALSLLSLLSLRPPGRSTLLSLGAVDALLPFVALEAGEDDEEEDHEEMFSRVGSGGGRAGRHGSPRKHQKGAALPGSPGRHKTPISPDGSPRRSSRKHALSLKSSHSRHLSNIESASPEKGVSDHKNHHLDVDGDVASPSKYDEEGHHVKRGHHHHHHHHHHSKSEVHGGQHHHHHHHHHHHRHGRHGNNRPDPHVAVVLANLALSDPNFEIDQKARPSVFPQSRNPKP